MKYNLYIEGVSVEAVFNKLGGVSGAERFLADELILVEKSSLKPVAVEARDFPLWRTLILGQHKSHGAYRKALESSGFRIGDYAGQILKKISVSQTPIEVDLVRLTVAELGFQNGARRDAIYARAIELGLELCPAEVGPALRLVYQEPAYTVVGMEPITDSDDGLGVFRVNTDSDDRWLRSDYGKPDHFWCGNRQWVFVRPRKVA